MRAHNLFAVYHPRKRGEGLLLGGNNSQEDVCTQEVYSGTHLSKPRRGGGHAESDFPNKILSSGCVKNKHAKGRGASNLKARGAEKVVCGRVRSCAVVCALLAQCRLLSTGDAPESLPASPHSLDAVMRGSSAHSSHPVGLQTGQVFRTASTS